MPYATAKDGTRLYYKDWGEGRPVVLVHGWPLSADTFDDAAMALAERGCRAIAPDRRGFGRSERPEPFVTNVHVPRSTSATVP